MAEKLSALVAEDERALRKSLVRPPDHRDLEVIKRDVVLHAATLLD